MIGLALVKGLLWATLLPPWYGPDEPAHYVYVETLAEGRLPAYAPSARSDGADIPPDVACSEQNLGWHPDGPLMEKPFLAGQNPAPCAQGGAPAARRPAVPSNPAAGYTPLYYAVAIPFLAAAGHAPVETRLFSVRLLSVLLGALATLFVYLGGFWALDGRRRLAVAAAGVYALQPMLSQQYAIVSNDAFLDFLGAAFAWRLARALRIQPDLREVALLAALAGIAYLAKPQGILLALLLPLPALAAIRAGRLGWRALAGQTMVAGGVLATVALAGLVFNLASQGSLVPQGGTPTARDSFRHYLDLNLGGYATHLWWLWVATVWGDFGWLTVALPRHLYEGIAGVLVMALAGAAWAALRGRPEPALALAAMLLVLLPLQAWEALFFRQHGQLVLQGRNLLFAFPAAAIFVAGGLAALLPRGCERFLSAALGLAAAALNGFAVLVLLEAFYG